MIRTLFISWLVFSIYTTTTICQSTQSYPSISSERAAEGQTKWLQHELKLDNSLYQTVYDINYKYQLKEDSIHLIVKKPEESNRLYQINRKKKAEEFKHIFPKQIYDQYLQLVESVKNPAIK
jgi:hypothetical protein